MYKKEITYTDYNGTTRTETFYFNLTRAEIANLEMLTPGGLAGHIEKIIAAKDGPELIKLFQFLIEKSYGKKSDDGRRFVKNQEVLDDFLQTEAYSSLYMELVTNTDFAVEFCNGIMPALSAEEQKRVDAEVARRMGELESGE